MFNGYRASILQNEMHSGGGFLLRAVQHYESIQYHCTVHLKVVKMEQRGPREEHRELQPISRDEAQRREEC